MPYDWTATQIKAARLFHSWNQQTLANKLGRSVTTISAWETGRKVPSFVSRRDLSRLFGDPSQYEKGE